MSKVEAARLILLASYLSSWRCGRVTILLALAHRNHRLFAGPPGTVRENSHPGT